MRSSTSNFRRLTAAERPGVAQPVPEREVPQKPWGYVLFAAFLIATALSGAWEWHWRSFGAIPGYRDDAALWARQRRRIDHGAGNATVLIGSSRTFFDIQLPVWERLAGRRPIQLARNGSSPLFLIEDLANDPVFTGRLLVGIAPNIFFSGYQQWKGLTSYIDTESPSQRVGKILSMYLVEPWFAFYDPSFALFNVLRSQPWPERGDIPRYYSLKYAVTQADRNNYMWDKLANDAAYRALARNVQELAFYYPLPTPEESAEYQRNRDVQITKAAAAVARLRSRGVSVIFVRDPSEGDYLADEDFEFPRQTSWDVLLKKTAVPGIYFQDFSELQGYDLPEMSHMTRESAEHYTEALYGVIARKYPPSDGSHW